MPLKELKSELRKRFDRKERTLQRRAKRIKDDHGPMSWELAWAILAQDVGVDAAGYLDHPPDAAEVRRIRRDRALLDSPEARKRAVSPTKTIVVRIGTEFQLKDPLLPQRVLSDAKAMADVYPYLYVFENSVREVVKRTLEKSHGENWWDTCSVPPRVRQGVKIRMADEEYNPWHGRRGAHEIYYTLISDLKSIIVVNWSDFKHLFPEGQVWIKQTINVIGRSRRVVAHNNPLQKRDIERIKLFFGDWSRQIQSVKHLLEP